MRHKFYFIPALFLITLFAGCGQQTGTTDTGVLGTMKNLQDLTKNAQDFEKAQLSGNPEEAAKSLQNFQQVFANMEVGEFEKAAAIDLPIGFPAELVYKSGKVLESGDSSTADYVDLTVGIKTTDASQKVQNFYKAALSSGGWQIKSQSVDSNTASFVGKKDTREAEINIDISQQGSLITAIRIYYHGDK